MIAARLSERRWTVVVAGLVAIVTAPAGQTWWASVLSYMAQAVALFVQHDCDGRLVSTKMIEVALK